MINQIINGGCLETMKKIESNSIDMVLSDLPFEMTENEWDKIIPFEPMWEQILRITKNNAAIVFMSAGMFTAELMLSNKKHYRYSWVWKPKEKANFLNASRMPLRQHIDIPVFYKKLPIYNPQKTYGHRPMNKYKQHTTAGANYGKTKIGMEGGGQTDRYPTTVIDVPYKTISIVDRIHPTQKPVEIYEYLIKTYTNVSGTVIDFAAGSCTLAEAAININRNYICIEKEENYCNLASARIEKHINKGHQMRIV